MFKILVAEDDAELRQLFCRVLTRHGFQPIGAADGVEALQVLERDYIDLIVSDIMMPRLDGYALVRGLRDSGSTELEKLSQAEIEELLEQAPLSLRYLSSLIEFPPF